MMPAASAVNTLREPDPRGGDLPRDRPFVSVVILNHNYGRYLRECVDSVLEQDYAPLEVVVVDDGSSDGSGEVIASYGDRVVGVLKANGGVASAMNRGFEASHGEIVLFLDADDFLLPGAVADHVRAHREPRVVRSQVYLTILNEAPWPHTRAPGEAPAEGDLRDLVLERGPGAYVSAPQSGNAWARRYLERVLPLPETLKGIGADALLMDTAPLFGTTVLVRQEPRAVYRVHDKGMNAAKAGGMTVDNIRRAIGRLDARAARLEQVARSLGHDARRSDWRRRNWRLMTLDHLAARIGDSAAAGSGVGQRSGSVSGASGGPPHNGLCDTVPLAVHVRPVWRVRGSLAKRAMLAATLVCIRLAPMRLSLYLAGRIINLRYT